MTKKQYQVCRLAIVIVLAMSISVSISLKNYYLPIIFVLSAAAGLYYCRKQLQAKDVLADERDYHIAGNAARYAIFIYSWLGAIGTFVLMALSEKEKSLYPVSQFLAFSVCALMLLNAFLFKYLQKKDN